MKTPVFDGNIGVENDPEFVEIWNFGKSEFPVFGILPALLLLLQGSFRKSSRISLASRHDLDFHRLQCQLALERSK